MPPKADFLRHRDGGCGLPREGSRARCQQRSMAVARGASPCAPSSQGCSGGRY